MIYADFDYYTNQYLGNLLTAQDFPRLAKRASEFIDYYTQGRAEKSTCVEQIKLACCAVAEQQYMIDTALQLSAKRLYAGMNEDGAEVQSESVGSWSRSYRTGGESVAALSAVTGERKALAEAAARYLAHTGLISRGGCCR